MMDGLYKYKNVVYRRLGDIMMKDPSTGNWLEAAGYTGYVDTKKSHPSMGGPIFVREMQDFLAKFVKLEEGGGE